MERTPHDKLAEISRNLWWTWHPEVIALLRDLDRHLWRRLHHNPIALLQELPPETLAECLQDTVLLTRLNRLHRALTEYVQEPYTWTTTNAGPLLARPVAYFSAEFGLHESLPIYSGGLGVLAGDHLKSASDLGIPMWAVGLLYREGYFFQRLTQDGWQQEDYLALDVSKLPLTLVRDTDGAPLVVRIDTGIGPLQVQAWQAEVGRAHLLLLETVEDPALVPGRHLTARLYGGDQQTRIAQEVVLGVGGMRVLRWLGVNPGVIHLNEGHCAFGVLEAIRMRIADTRKSFDEAAREVSSQVVFTTHTPVEAGHDRFPGSLVLDHLGPLRSELGLSDRDFLGLGRVRPDDPNEPFCMTVLALKLSRLANAVSGIHGGVSRRMWSSLWPGRREEEIPIGHVTNGVHFLSWLAPEMFELFRAAFGPGWANHQCHPDFWKQIESLDPAELWEVHHILKAKLISFVRRRLVHQQSLRGPDPSPFPIESVFDSEALTIGFARRFAPYKRANLLFRDPDRLKALLTSPTRPVQIIFAGKAHPNDEAGKKIIQEIVRFSADPRVRGRVAFVEDYDMDVARHLVQGVDVWLNVPRRPLEACGTSGQKVILNGGLNCSILDGWWAEAYDGKNGFAIGDGSVHADPGEQDRRDSEALFQVLEGDVIPLFYDRMTGGLPLRWIGRMKRGIRTLAWRFNSDRMVMDYVLSRYLTAVGGRSREP